MTAYSTLSISCRALKQKPSKQTFSERSRSFSNGLCRFSAPTISLPPHAADEGGGCEDLLQKRGPLSSTRVPTALAKVLTYTADDGEAFDLG